MVLGIALAALAFQGGGAPMTSTFGGNLRVPEAKTTVGARCAGTDWHVVSGELVSEPAGDGLYRLKLRPEVNLPPIDCTLAVSNVPGGGVHTDYAFVPTEDVSLNMLGVEAVFQYGDYAGGHIEADGRRIEFPDGREPVRIFRGTVSKLVISGTGENPRIVFAFDEPTSVLVQNGRFWGFEDFLVRILADGGAEFAKGRVYRVAMTISGAGEYDPAGGRPVEIGIGPDWVPLAANPWIAPGSALDVSALRPTGAPAGRHGRVVTRGGHFEFENLPGVPQRFYGVNICEDANVPPLGSADRFAANLARAGYNAIRFHHHETDLVKGTGDPSATTLNPERLQCFDALVASCIEHGLYLTTDLFVSRRGISWRSVGEDRDGEIDMETFKYLVPVHEGVWSNFVAFARNFLGHRNPLTGRTLAEEPAMVGLSLVNEGPLDHKDPAWYGGWPQWRSAWHDWLSAKKASDPEHWGGVSEEPLPNGYDSPESAAFLVFLQEMEGRFAARVRAFLRDELNCRVPLANMNNGKRRAFQAVRHDAYDYVDLHFYIDHPVFLGKWWRLPQYFPNVNPMKSPKLGGLSLVSLRFFDRPFTISEWNYCGPGRFRGLGGVATGTEAALQDWSGLWRFAWGHGVASVTQPEKKGLGPFDVVNDPLQRASDLACVFLFLRGDMAQLEDEFVVGLPRSSLAVPDKSLNESAAAGPELARAGWSVRIGTRIDGGRAMGASLPEAPGRDVSTKRPNSAVAIDEATGRFLFSTPRMAGGFAERGRIDAGPLSFEIVESPYATNHSSLVTRHSSPRSAAAQTIAAATVWAASLDGRPLEHSSRILVAHITDVQPKGSKYADEDMNILLSWGEQRRMVMRRGRANVSIRVAPGSYKVYSLNANGTRRATVPSHMEKGRFLFTAQVDADPASATWLYEIVNSE